MANLTGLEKADFDSLTVGGKDLDTTLTDFSNNFTTILTTISNTTFNSALPDSTTVQSTIGGLSSGTTAGTLKTKTLDQIFDTIFFPTQNPNITDPQIGITLTGSPTGVKLVGTTLNYSVDISFPSNRNRVTLSGASWSPEQPYTGDLSLAQYTLLGESSYNNFDSFSSWNNVAVKTGLSHVVTEGGNGNIKVRVRYSAGTFQPLDSVGDNFGSPFSATSTYYSANSSSVEGVYPRFNNNSSGGQDQQTLQTSSQNNIVINQAYQETASLRHGWEFPELIFTGRTWVVQAFNELTNSYQDLDNQSQFTVTNTTKTINGNSVNYRKYTNTGSLSGNNNYRLRF